jgi:hypothetical protein
MPRHSQRSTSSVPPKSRLYSSGTATGASVMVAITPAPASSRLTCVCSLTRRLISASSRATLTRRG